MTPAFQTKSGSATIYAGNCITTLQQLPAGSVQCCITSPPYWGLRDYGHDGQHGLEKTPDEYVETMVAVFREVRRVLRDDGTCWLNLGDSYAASAKTTGRNDNGQRVDAPADWQCRYEYQRTTIKTAGLKPKDLVGIPWRVAFALQADGWYLRQDIIWHKPNPMPESVQDRCTKAHEYIFLLTKSARYYYDAEAVKEAGSGVTWNSAKSTLATGGRKGPATMPDGSKQSNYGAMTHHEDADKTGRNRRSVWTVSTKPYSGAHFATYPPDLIEPCLLAGTSERGRCKECGAAWGRVVEVRTIRQRADDANTFSERPKSIQSRGSRSSGLSASNSHSSSTPQSPLTQTTGWQPTCQCNAGEPVPCVVLDPYNGSGTTGAVAVQHGRHYLGCELNPDYIALAAKRIGDAERRWGTPLFDPV